MNAQNDYIAILQRLTHYLQHVTVKPGSSSRKYAVVKLTSSGCARTNSHHRHIDIVDVGSEKGVDHQCQVLSILPLMLCIFIFSAPDERGRMEVACGPLAIYLSGDLS